MNQPDAAPASRETSRESQPATAQMVVVDTAGHVLESPQAISSWLGESVALGDDLFAVLDRRWRLPEDLQPGHQAETGTAMLQPRQAQDDRPLLLTWHQHGVELFLHLAWAAPSGAPEVLVKLLLDRVRHLTTQQEKLMDQLLQTAEEQGRIHATSSLLHDFNNHLTGVCTLSELVAQDYPDDENLALILETARKGQVLMTRIVRFNRERPSDVEWLDVGGVLEQSRDIIEAVLHRRSRLTLEVPEQPVEVRMLRPSLESLFVELARNSQRAARDQKIEFSIGLRRDDEAGQAVLDFRDDAGGLPTESAGQIWDPLFSTWDQPGLGLAMVRHRVKQAGGTIEVESDPEKEGTLVRVRLPLAVE